MPQVNLLQAKFNACGPQIYLSQAAFHLKKNMLAGRSLPTPDLNKNVVATNNQLLPMKNQQSLRPTDPPLYNPPNQNDQEK